MCAEVHLCAPVRAGMPMAAAGEQFCCFLSHLMHSSLVTSVCDWLHVMSSGILGLFVLLPFPIICSAMSHWLANLLYHGRTTCFVLHKYYCSPPWCVCLTCHVAGQSIASVSVTRVTSQANGLQIHIFMHKHSGSHIMHKHTKPVTAHPPHPPHVLY